MPGITCGGPGCDEEIVEFISQLSAQPVDGSNPSGGVARMVEEGLLPAPDAHGF
jgi:hypothetical protein